MSWKVDHLVRRGSLVYAIVTTVNVEPEAGSVVVCNESGGRYRLLSIGMGTNPRAWAQGARSLQLEPVDEPSPLTEGMHLQLVT